MNLKDHIEKYNTIFSERINKNLNGFVQQDIDYWTIYNNTFTLSIIPDAVMYIKNDSEAYLPFKITLTSFNKNKYKSFEMIKDVLYYLEYTPIRDDDANFIEDFFKISNNDDCLTIECWIIPEFPNGYWENHILIGR